MILLQSRAAFMNRQVATDCIVKSITAFHSMHGVNLRPRAGIGPMMHTETWSHSKSVPAIDPV